MQSKQVSPALMAAIIVVALLVFLGGGYFFFLRPRDSEGISDKKLTPEDRAKQAAASRRITEEYMKTRNGGSGAQSPK